MDGIQPVGAMIQPPSPNQGLETWADILGIQSRKIQIQQQQQNLQTGQYRQEQEQSGAQQQQEQMSERQRLQQQMQSGAFGDPESDDYGTKVANWARGNLPLIGNDVAQAAVKTQSDKLALRDAATNLDIKQRGQLGGLISGFVGKPFNGKAIDSAIDDAVDENPSLMKAAYHAKNLIDHLDNTSDQATHDQALSHLAATLQGQPAEAPTSIDTGSQVIPGASNRITGAFQPSGAPVKKQLAPTQELPYVAASTGAQARASGVAGSDIDRSNLVSANIAPSKAAIQLTHDIDDLADQIHSGTFAGAISKAAAAAGLSEDTYARQLLAKDLGQVQARATDHSPTDKSRDTILSGYPESTSDPQTIHTAMDYIRGSFKQNVARGQNLIQYRQQHPTLEGFQQSDDKLTSTKDPLRTEYESLKPGAERQGFLQRNFKSKEEAYSFLKGEQ